ncbi:MAG: hemin uptake protein HemP [Pseudohongiellaceae bacterium]|jgi:hemin uptake protein HemP
MKQDDSKHSKALNSLALGEISSAELTGQSKELVIIHNNERYLLRITSNNKLILTK